MWPGPYGEWGSRKYILASLDQSLQRLGLDYVDIFYSHRFDPNTPLEETMGALDQAVRSGKALYVGVDNLLSGARIEDVTIDGAGRAKSFIAPGGERAVVVNTSPGGEWIKLRITARLKDGQTINWDVTVNEHSGELLQGERLSSGRNSNEIEEIDGFDQQISRIIQLEQNNFEF